MSKTLHLVVSKESWVAIKLALTFLISFSCSGVYSGGEVVIKAVSGEVSPELQGLFGSLFKRANVLSVVYIPYEKLGSRQLDKGDLLKAWRYNFSYRCSQSCELEGKDIQAFFGNAFRLEAECPVPYTIAIEFKRNSGVIESVFVNSSGRCFTVGGESYFVVEGSAYDFFPKNELFSTFLGKN